MMRTKNSRLRWHLKKTARKSFILGAKSFRLLTNACSRKVVRVLTYHRFGNRAYDPFRIDSGLFKEQMHFIQAHNKVVSYTDFIEFLRGNLQMAQNSVLVTIDDGYFSVYKDALPVLVELGIPAIVFVSPGQLEDQSGIYQKGTNERRMTWKELRELSDEGITIGSHGFNHRSMAQILRTEAKEEAHRSRKSLEDVLGHSISTFAYPYGTRGDYNKTTTSILKKCGYDCAFTAVHGTCSPGQNPFCIPRIQIESGEGLELFSCIVKGGLDYWRIIDERLWRLKATRN